MEDDFDYITVLDYANFIGKTQQCVYTMIRAGLVETKRFRRGSMNGYLIKKPAEYDQWLSKKQ